MLWFHLFWAHAVPSVTSERRTKHAFLCECESGTRQATSWPGKIMGDNISPAGIYLFHFHKRGKWLRCSTQSAGHHREIVFSAIHRQKRRITEINWIFDLSWRKFDVNEIGHYTRALFFMPSPPSTSPSPPPNWQRWTARKNCHSIAQSGRSSELSDWCRPTTFAMTWPSDQNLERKTQFHYIKAAIVSPNNRCSTWCHSQLVILHIHFSIEWDKTTARAHHISHAHIHLTFQRIERVRTRSLTLGHETGNYT